MKRILFLLFVALALNLSAVAQDDTTRVTEWEDTVESVDTSPDNDISESNFWDGQSSPFEGDFWEAALGIVVIVFGIPVVIVFIAFYFQYRNRRERYRLAEKALEAGQPIPEEFMNMNGRKDMLSKGIHNICIGIGLFIFLWAITSSLAIGTIGLLIMFTGFAQVITHYVNNGKKNK